MKFNYKLRRLCGSYYGYPIPSTTGNIASQWSGSNVIFDSTGNQLISATLNRIQIIDLKSVTVRTLPIESRSNISCLALHAPFLVAVDVQNYVMIIHYYRGIVLHRLKIKQKVRTIQFSPSGRYLAIGCGKHVQVWCMPGQGQARTFCPLTLHRTYTGQNDDIVNIEWSIDETVLAASSRDTTVRIWTLHTTRNYEPITLSGHKSTVLGFYFGPPNSKGSTRRIETAYSISADGSIVTWECQYEDNIIQVIGDNKKEYDDDMMGLGDEAVDFFTGGGGGGGTHEKTSQAPVGSSTKKSFAHQLVGSRWSVKKRTYFDKEGGDVSVTSCSYCSRTQLLAVGFSSGIFGLYEMPDVANIHTLSVGSSQLVKACTLNNNGDWLALACPISQQLLVWEWRSETYVLKQRGHAYGMKCMAYSPDSVCVATGGEDGKIKLWNASTGFCYVTLAEKTHTAAVTAITFANASVVITASLDGTVKAHDLHRYRTFKTLTTPTPVQFISLAVDSAGEVVVAGSTDPFHIYTWNLQTGKLLDILSGHAGPICDLTFQHGTGTLISASWDGTVKTWDLYKGDSVPAESFQHNTDVVCVACRPDGKQVCTGTIGGLLSFWNVEDGKLLFEIDGRRDITGGRKINDRMTSDNNAASRYFTSVCYSADGSCVLAGGNSKYVCIYEVSHRILLKKFQISFNRSLDGVLDELNSKNLGDGGPINEEEESDNEGARGVVLPGAKRGDDGSRTSKVEVLTMQVSFAPTGREWAIVSGEGLHIYSLDDDMIFDPISLTEAITPSAVVAKLAASEYGLALRMAIHLNEFALVKDVLEATPYDSIAHVVRNVGPEQLERLLHFLTKVMEDSPHIEFYLQWSLELLQTHGMYMDKHRSTFMRSFRSMYKAISTKYDDIKTICNENKYMLDFLHDHGKMVLEHEKDVPDATMAG